MIGTVADKEAGTGVGRIVGTVVNSSRYRGVQYLVQQLAHQWVQWSVLNLIQ